MSKIEVDEIVNQTGDNDSGLDLSTNDNIKFKIANAEKAIIDANGNVGLGTSSPPSFGSTFTVLQANNSASGVVQANNSTNSVTTEIEAEGTRGAVGTRTNHDFVIKTNQTERMRIKSSEVVINEDGADLDFRVEGVAEANVLVVDAGNDNVLIGCNALPSDSVGGAGFENASSDRMILNLSTTTTSNRNVVVFRNPNNAVGSINTSGTTTGFNTSSDYRLKENVVTEWDATTRLKQLKPSRFNFKADKDTTVDGFLAHEVSSIVPVAVSGEKDETQDLGTIKDKDGNVIRENVLETQTKKDDGQTWTKTKTEDVYQGIDQSKLVPLLTKALQEAVTKIETLEAKVTALEGK